MSEKGTPLSSQLMYTEKLVDELTSKNYNLQAEVQRMSDLMDFQRRSLVNVITKRNELQVENAKLLQLLGLMVDTYDNGEAPSAAMLLAKAELGFDESDPDDDFTRGEHDL